MWSIYWYVAISCNNVILYINILRYIFIFYLQCVIISCINIVIREHTEDKRIYIHKNKIVYIISTADIVLWSRVIWKYLLYPARFSLIRVVNYSLQCTVSNIVRIDIRKRRIFSTPMIVCYCCVRPVTRLCCLPPLFLWKVSSIKLFYI